MLPSEPIAEANSNLLHTLDSTDPRRQIRTEKTAVSRFVGQTTHRPEPKIDRSGGQFPELEVDAVPKYHGLVEGETRLRAIPVNELVDGVPVAALGIWASQAIENGGFRVVQIGQPKDCLRCRPFLSW